MICIEENTIVNITKGTVFFGTALGFIWGYQRFLTSKTPLTGLVLDTFYGCMLGLFWPLTIGFATLAYGDHLILQARSQNP